MPSRRLDGMQSMRDESKKRPSSRSTCPARSAIMTHGSYLTVRSLFLDVSPEAATRSERRIMRIRSILVPTDFSPHSARALQDAIDLARKHGAKIHLLHTHSPWVPCPSPDGIFAFPEALQAERSFARSRLEEQRQVLLCCGVAHEVRFSDLGAIPAILELALLLDVDLIVVASPRRAGIRRLLPGSIGEQAARLAPCPVMIVPDTVPAAAQRAEA